MNLIESEANKRALILWPGKPGGVIKDNEAGKRLAEAFDKPHREDYIKAFIEGAMWALSTPQKSPVSDHEVVSTEAIIFAKSKLKAYCEEWSDSCQCKACRNIKKLEKILTGPEPVEKEK